MDERLLTRSYLELGLKPALLQQLLALDQSQLPWRVCAVDRGLCTVLGLDDADEHVFARVLPPAEPVAVGDWVVLDRDRISTVLERSSVLRRGAVDVEGRQQLIAANLDVVFVVSAFAETAKLERRGLNPRRIERYVAAVRDGGALPVAVLNKVDLAARDPAVVEALRRELSTRLANIDVVCVSARARAGLEELERYLTAGETVAFVGPSGVGKSSLINALSGAETQPVGDVRERDTKGRHTTSRRELLVMPTKALLVDTPGVRQFAVLTESETVAGFDDIDALAESCRFADCAHGSEPGCAVVAAVEGGTLARDRLDNYHALVRDAKRLHARHDGLARHLERKDHKAFGRMVRETMAIKKRS